VSTGRILKYRLIGAVSGVILGIIYLAIQGWWNNLPVRDSGIITTVTVVTPNPTPTPTITAPNVLLAPYDRNAAEVISEMLAIAEEANPGLIWFSTQHPTLSDCELPNGQPGQAGNLIVRWGMGDYDAIRAADANAGLTEWRMIQQLNDAADDKMIEAWTRSQEITPEVSARLGIDQMKGNWYFGYIFPGLSGGSSTFDLDDGVGILDLQTLCLQPVPATPSNG
jgi:hypothetical protein